MGTLTTLFDTSALIGPNEGAGPRMDGECAVSVVALGELTLLTTDEGQAALPLVRTRLVQPPG
jgi:hypothetical protein